MPESARKPTTKQTNGGITTKTTSKGSRLNSWTPHLVVRLYDSGKDPTSISQLEELPRWKGCPIWDQQLPFDEKKEETAEGLPLLQDEKLQKFLHRTRRQSVSQADESALTNTASWNFLCLLATIHVVARHSREKVSTQSPSASYSFWSSLIPQNRVVTKGILINDGGDDDDDGNNLLIEIWPLIQQYIPWNAFRQLFSEIQNELHAVNIPHPLTKYAQETIFQLDDLEFEKSWSILCNIQLQHSRNDNTALTLTSSKHRLRASQLWLDQVANLPPRTAGILLRDPLQVLERSTSCHKGDAPCNEGSGTFSFPTGQSCLPNTCLEFVTDEHDFTCALVALYDLSENREAEILTLSTRPKSLNCTCFHCVHKMPRDRIKLADLPQARRLAHLHFQRECFEDAFNLYKWCHKTVLQSSDTQEYPSSSPNLNVAADLWHSMAAVLLAQYKFVKAQCHWKEGIHYQKYHKEIREQLEKQRSYQYFDPLPQTPTKILPSYTAISRSAASSTLGFVASNVVEPSICRYLIQCAADYAEANGGWTTSRHYAVPTTDLPIHKVPRLLEWFQNWMPEVLFPLLCDQFTTNTTFSKQQQHRFYVHDAFLVRYESTSSNHFLPLHYDESTHSCVLALNDDFEGGGTYMYDLQKSVSPPAGSLVSFRGNKCLHGGSPVTRGIRYILAIFLYLDEDTTCCPMEVQKARSSFATDKSEHEKRALEDSNKAYIDETSSTKAPSLSTDKSPSSSKRLKNASVDEYSTGSRGFSFSFF